ncbi:carboxypeptidase [Fusarium albosuccineum]|uniref:Carboxypeptidase n=1 Tax=Fusarium albosuccineum TaxID=1237068 RepID=A0A8H4LBW0_9HYPO|nr:carboxypeptidase [Fusarium albosuccineum]
MLTKLVEEDPLCLIGLFAIQRRAYSVFTAATSTWIALTIFYTCTDAVLEEARNNPDTAPTALYLAGGPGASAFDMLSSFPCNYDSNSTTTSPWSWNNNVKLLYIDQPIGTGSSSAERFSGTVDTLDGDQPLFKALEEGEPLPETNARFLAGTMDPRRNETTAKHHCANGSNSLAVFSGLVPRIRVARNLIFLNLADKYGGYWTPAFFSYILDQNDLIKANKHPNENATTLSLGTLGIANGCIDMYSQAMSAPQMAYNNTYGIKAYSEEVSRRLPKLCQSTKVFSTNADLSRKERSLWTWKDERTNEACRNASKVCFFGVHMAYNKHSNARTADAMISDLTPLEHVLQRGINVAFVYGDRDYQCNWMGAETVSLTVDYPSASDFRAAGYEDIVTNSSYRGGLVRQHGSFSFSQVFDIGHAIAFYQPEKTYRTFQRAMFGKDVATGETDIDNEYSTEGPSEVWSIKTKAPKTSPENVCYTYHAFRSCTDEQRRALADGTAVVENFVVISPKGVNLKNDTAGGQAGGDGDQEDDGADKASTGVTLKGSSLGMLMGSFIVMCLCSAILS